MRALEPHVRTSGPAPDIIFVPKIRFIQIIYFLPCHFIIPKFHPNNDLFTKNSLGVIYIITMYILMTVKVLYQFDTKN